MPKLFVSNKDESARLFKSDILELFTHVHWSVPVIIYLPVVVTFLFRAVQQGVVTPLEVAGFFPFGLLVWTLTEYLLHRYVFHL